MAEASQEPPSIPDAGELIAGKYEVLATIGAGAMGVVVSAQHRDLAQKVAIKFIAPSRIGQANAQARFVREARAVAALESEYIVRILDLGMLNGETPYMVMQYLRGRDLLAELRAQGGSLSITEAVDCLLQACAGLAEAHARGIVHRDIKPGNLFITRRANGEVLLKVLDFGISKAQTEFDDQLSLTATDSVLGSPLYMSPEQVRHAKSVDQRSDIWSLGVVLYHSLTGTTPFEATGATGVAAAIVADTPISIRARKPEVPAELGDIVERCLQKSPAFRFQSVIELARALAPFASRRGKLVFEQLQAAFEAGVSDVDADSNISSTYAEQSASPARQRRKPNFLATGAALLIGAGLALLGTKISHSAAGESSPKAVAERDTAERVAPVPSMATTPNNAAAPNVNSTLTNQEPKFVALQPVEQRPRRQTARSPRLKPVHVGTLPVSSQPLSADPLDGHE